MINGWIIGGTPSAISHWIKMEKENIPYLQNSLLFSVLVVP
jgi:hypothetical protein